MRILSGLLLTVFLFGLAPLSAYAALGSIKWEVTYTSRPAKNGDHAKALAINEQGDLVVAGYVTSRDGNNDYEIIKYGPYGTTEWVNNFDRSWSDIARAVAFDGMGNILVAGTSYNLDNPRDSYSGAYYSDYHLVKYSSAGEVLQEMTASGNGKDNDLAGLAVDREGGVYVTGIARSAPDTFSFLYTVKFDISGNRVWEKFEDWGPESYAAGIKVTPDGALVLAGYYKEPGGTYDIRVQKYDPATGKTFMDVVYDQFDDEKASDLAVGADGSIIIMGETSADDGATLTLKYSAEGELVWARHYKNAEYGSYGNGVTVDKQGRIYLAGKTIKPDAESGGDWLLVIYDKDGRFLFDKAYAFGGDSGAEDIAVDIYGNIVMTGNSRLLGQPSVVMTLRVECFSALQAGSSKKIQKSLARNLALNKAGNRRKSSAPPMLKPPATATATALQVLSPAPYSRAGSVNWLNKVTGSISNLMARLRSGINPK